MAFLETVTFPEGISYGSSGGPGWSTSVVSFKSGAEQRNQNWSATRHRYDVGYGVKTLDDLHALVAIFNQARGMANGFRYKDWLDYSATQEALTITGAPTAQLVKTYGSGASAYTRTITKPRSGASFRLGGAPLTVSSVDTATGVVTFNATATVTVIDATNESNGLITTDPVHGLTTGKAVYFSGVGGMTELNGNGYTITVVNTSQFRINVDTTSYGTYTTGGTGSLYPQSSDVVDWTGEFDVPVRFDIDELSVVLSHYEAGSVSVPLVEIRV